MDLLEVGKIINTHGLKGDVKVTSWTDFPEVFEDLTTVYIKQKNGYKPLTVGNIKYQKNNLIVKFAELSDINEAERFKNQVLYAERDALGELEEGTYYIADLIGVEVFDENDNLLGKIKDVAQTGANDIYIIERPQKRDLLIPVLPQVVLSMDIEAKKTVVHLLEGLEDL